MASNLQTKLSINDIHSCGKKIVKKTLKQQLKEKRHGYRMVK